MLAPALALLIALLVPSAQDRPAPVRATIASLAWLAGDWAGTVGRSIIEERWTPAAGGAMLGVGRTVREDRLTAFEFLRIVERDGGLVYIAQPNGVPPTDFVLTAITADSVTFENPSHDFPKRVRYMRRADGSLEATVSGTGGEKAQVFVFKRQMPR